MGTGWLMCIPAGFASTLTLSLHDSECSRKLPNAHSLGRYDNVKKKNN